MTTPTQRIIWDKLVEVYGAGGFGQLMAEHFEQETDHGYGAHGPGSIRYAELIGGSQLSDFERAYWEDFSGVKPTVTITSPTDGQVIEINASVLADFTATSNPVETGMDTIVGTVADGAAIDTATLGVKTFTVTATDLDANVRVKSHNYTVVDTVNPVTTVTLPADGATYAKDATVIADFACTDTGGSGVASCVGTVADGVAIDTSTEGASSFTATGTDNAGNTHVVTNNFTISAAAATPLLDVGWEHAYLADGPEMVALAYSDTDAVSSWPDEVGTADLAQGTGTAQPAYSAAGGANGAPTITFDGSGDYVIDTTVVSQSQPLTVVAIATNNETGSITGNMTGGGTDNGAIMSTVSGQWFWNAGVPTSTGVTDDIADNLFVGYFNGGSSTLTINGIEIDAASVGTDGLANGLILGAKRTPNNYWLGDIAFVGVFSGDVTSDPNWNAFLGEVESKYGIECGYADPANPLLSVRWEHAYQADGPAMTALAYSDTDAVSSWPDETLSGGADMVQATGTDQPAYGATSGPGSQPAIDFDGTTDDIGATGMTNPTSTIYSVVMVGELDVATNNRMLNRGDTGTVLLDVNSAKWRYYAGAAGLSDQAVDANPHLWVVRINKSTTADNILVDGVLTTDTAGNSALGTELTVGAKPGTSYMNGKASFVATFDGDVTTDPNWFAFLDEVYSKYGIDARPPTAVGFRNLYWTEGPEFEALALSDTDAVSSWPDENNLANHDAVQATGTDQPIYEATGGPNSLPAVTGDGVSDKMVVDNALFTDLAEPYSVVVVGAIENQGSMTGDDGGNDGGRIASSGGAWLIKNGTVQSGGTSDTAAHLFTLASDTTDILEVDGSAAISAAAGTDTLQGIQFFARRNAGFAQGPASLIGIYDGDARTSAAWTQFENYIAWKYGLTIA